VGLQLAVGRQPSGVASDRGVGGGGAHIVVSRFMATPSCEIETSQGRQKPLNTEPEQSMELEAVT
jgi:hypothetical protein